MNIYLLTLILGAAGFVAMAATGLGRHHGHTAGLGRGHGGAAGGHHGGAGRMQGSHGGGAGRAALILMSPRLLFAFLFGLGVTGLLLQHILAGFFLLIGAIAGGVLVERFIVAPLWGFTMRFASRPALMIESTTTGEATAVTSFDANGHGIVALEVDGQVVQVLATLLPSTRVDVPRVRAGQVLRVEEVDPARNRCTVSVI